jgi:hypothetical protein
LVVVGVLAFALFTVNARLRDEQDAGQRRADQLAELTDLVERAGDALDAAALGDLADVGDLDALRVELRKISATSPGVAPTQTTPQPSASPVTSSAPGPRGPAGLPGSQGDSGPRGATATADPAPSPSPSKACLLRAPVLDICLTP